MTGMKIQRSKIKCELVPLALGGQQDIRGGTSAEVGSSSSVTKEGEDVGCQGDQPEEKGKITNRKPDFKKLKDAAEVHVTVRKTDLSSSLRWAAPRGHSTELGVTSKSEGTEWTLGANC